MRSCILRGTTHIGPNDRTHLIAAAPPEGIKLTDCPVTQGLRSDLRIECRLQPSAPERTPTDLYLRGLTVYGPLSLQVDARTNSLSKPIPYYITLSLIHISEPT